MFIFAASCNWIIKAFILMNLQLTSTIKMPEHSLRRAVIDLCQKVGKPLLKLSTKDYVDNGLGHLIEQFEGQAGLSTSKCSTSCSAPLRAGPEANPMPTTPRGRSVPCLILSVSLYSHPILMTMSSLWVAPSEG